MRYRLRDGLSYCRVDDHVVFLDLSNDRYFELPHAAEAAFLSHVEDREAGEESERDVSGLLERGILTVAPTVHFINPPTALEPPACSALEQSTPNATPRLGVALEVFAIVCWTQIRLKTRRLDQIMGTLPTCEHGANPPIAGSSPSPAKSILEAAHEFRRARLYVPVETCCLLDTLSMVIFLARRRLRAHIVFGVKRNPFGAHCWAQAGDVVLNDTVGNVCNHTSILVV